MAKYRKKPVVVDAEQFFTDGPSLPGVRWESQNGYLIPYVVTIHGQRAYLADGDWVLQEPKEGHFYPCKPDIFAATYDPA